MKVSPFEKYLPLAEVEAEPPEFDLGISVSDPSEVQGATTKKLLPLTVTGAVLLIILVARLLSLQIVEGQQYRAQALGNSIRNTEIPAPRGLIVDRNGSPIVKNIARFDLEIIPAYLPRQESERSRIFDEVAATTGISVNRDEISQAGQSLEPRVLAENIAYEQALYWEMKLANLPGVSISRRPYREYADIAGLGHLLGYTGKISSEELAQVRLSNDARYGYTSTIGKTGLEKEYEDYLKGTDGRTQVEVDARGRTIRQLASIKPTPGHDLELYLDQRVQNTLSTALAAAVGRVGSKAGAAIAIDPNTGGILGLASFPTFQPEVFSSAQNKEEVQRLLTDSRHPLVNRAVAGRYPPGSTIKPIWAAAGLSEGTISGRSTVNSVGGFNIGEFHFPDWKSGGHGLTSVKKALAESVNTFFYAVAGGYGGIPGLGIERLKSYAGRVGLNAETKIDLPGESTGFFPDPAWKLRTRGERWFLGNTYQVGIGQGDVLVTPIEMLMSLNSLVNGGELLKPRSVKRVSGPDGSTFRTFDKEIIRNIGIPSEHLNLVKEGLRATVTEGSARSLSDLPVEAAGKTGTAQYAANRKTHAWFFGFAPWQDPQIAIMVIVEGGGEGTTAAAPVAKEVFRAYFSP